MRPVIFIYTEHFLPGWKAGGILRSIANFAEFFAKDFDLRILCSNKDLGQEIPYDLPVNEWITGENYSIFYYDDLSPEKIFKEVEKCSPDLVYLNSFLSKGTVFYLWKNLIKKSKTPVLVAPRGEFAPASFNQKKIKKSAFVLFSKIIGLYKNVNWQFSDKSELRDFTEVWGKTSNTFLALDLPSAPKNFRCYNKDENFKIIFLSRIVPEKNLHLAIEILKNVKTKVIFDIYGPVENQGYFESCLNSAKNLPENIKWNYKGEVEYPQVHQTFSKYDLFIFPSGGENFGHVVWEALSVGTPVLLSDKTPWKFEEGSRQGKTFPLDNLKPFSEEIERLSHEDLEFKLKKREDILKEIQQSPLILRSIEEHWIMLSQILKNPQ